MRKHDKNRKFGREKNQRNALIKSLLRSLVVHEGIDTTEAKAKEIRPHIEKLVTIARNHTIAGERLLESRIGIEAAKKLIKTIGPKYKGRTGGYTRVIKLPVRKSDSSKMAQIEFV